MLVLNVNTEQSVIIEQDGKIIGSIRVLKTTGGMARLAFQLPTTIGIYREAVYDRMKKESPQ